ncbi:MAG TPA: DUF4331 domain-containing protein [Actinomycetota bacterium]
MPYAGKRFRTIAVSSAATIALGVGLITGLGPAPSGASSHREAPLVAADPQIDATDMYAFVSPDKPSTVTLISNWIPFEKPAGGPNFYSFSPDAYYDINIDNDGDAKPDTVYRWIFTNHYRNTDTFLYNTNVVTSLTDPDLNFYQTYDLYRINGSGQKLLLDDAIVAPSDVGDASMPDYATLFNQATYTHNGGISAWAGQADDPFFLDLRVFDLLYGADFSEAGNDTLAGFNVNSFAIRISKKQLESGGDGSHIIGVWTTAERPSTRVQFADGSQEYSGNYVQVSRLGAPLVNEVVVPLALKDRFNASQPIDDAQFAPKVLTFGQDPNDLPDVVNALYGIQIPNCNPSPPIDRSCDLEPVFLTGLPGLNEPPNVTASEELRLNMDIAPCEPGSCSNYSDLGVIGGDNAGFPNGRRLADDVIDVALRVVEGVLIPGHDPAADGLADGVNANDVPFQSSFPYLALPHSGSDTTAPYAMKPRP